MDDVVSQFTIAGAIGSSSGLSANTSQYFLFQHSTLSSSVVAETQAQLRWSHPAVVSKLGARFNQTAQDRTGTLLVFRINGSRGNVSVTPTALGYFEDLIHTDTIAVNDLIDWEFYAGTGGTTSFTPNQIVYAYQATDATAAFNAGRTAAKVSTTVDQFFNFVNAPQFTANVGTATPQAGPAVWSGFAVNVITNSRTDVMTFRVRINNASGNQQLAYNPAETGLKEDTTHTDAIADQDTVVCHVDTNGGTGTFNLFFKVDAVGRVHTFAGSAGGNNTGSQYRPIEGNTIGITSDSEISVPARDAFTWRSLFARCTLYTPTITLTLATRINGVTGNLSVTITAVGDYSDLVHQDAVAAGQNINYIETITSSSGAMTLSPIASTQVVTAPLGPFLPQLEHRSPRGISRGLQRGLAA